MPDSLLLILLLLIGGFYATLAWARADQRFRIAQYRLLHATHELQQVRKDIARGDTRSPIIARSQELENALERIGLAIQGSTPNDAGTIHAVRTVLEMVAPQYVITAKSAPVTQRRSPEERDEFLQSVKEML